MSECFHEKYMHNGELKSSKSFSDEWIKKGLSIYEVVRIIHNKCLFLEDHMCRMQSSLDLFGYEYTSLIKEINNFILKYKFKIGLKNGNIKIVINYNNGLSKVPQVFIYQIKHYYPTSREYDKGINTSLLYGKRNRPNAKFINLKINQLVAEEFEHKNIHETLFVDENGNLTEGSKSNLFFVKDGIVYTPSDKGVLPGITRKHVIELCRELNISLTKTSIHISSIKDYDAAFITGTSVKILPIKHINHIEFNVKNKTMLRLMRCFDIKIDNYLLGTKESCSSIKK
jgi:branched-chain amino acid aminotransferase